MFTYLFLLNFVSKSRKNKDRLHIALYYGPWNSVYADLAHTEASNSAEHCDEPDQFPTYSLHLIFLRS
jgi:hypothetical protein